MGGAHQQLLVETSGLVQEVRLGVVSEDLEATSVVVEEGQQHPRGKLRPVVRAMGRRVGTETQSLRVVVGVAVRNKK